jgi:2-methylcitrate dehydratase PrpD
VWDLIGRTQTHHEQAYDRLPLNERLTTQVRLTLTDGRTRAKTVTHPRGTGDRALTNADILDKYRKLTERAISSQRQAAIENTILNIDTLDDVAHLTTLLTPIVQSPLD